MKASVCLCLVLIALFAAVASAAADGGQPEPASFQPEAVLPATRIYERLFEDAGRDADVPVELLQAIAFMETRWNHRSATNGERVTSHDGPPPAHGIMGLKDDGHFGRSLREAAFLIDRTPEAVAADPELNIQAAAAYLSYLGNGLTQASPLEEWRGAIEQYSGIPQPAIAAMYSYEVFVSIREGRASDRYRIRRRDVVLEKIYEPDALQVLSAPRVSLATETGQLRVAPDSADYPPAIWNPACSSGSSGSNYGTGRTEPVTHVAIHITATGGYASAISWFQDCNRDPGVGPSSAHYVIRSSDGQVTQMVREADTAYHVAGQNSYSIGIEHEVLEDDCAPYMTSNLYSSSAALLRDICASQGINCNTVYDASQGWNAEFDRSAQWKIKGHTNFPNTAKPCPTECWNWLTYRSHVSNSSGQRTLAVTSPNGGETWSAGTPRSITWTSSGLSSSGQLFVLLSKDGGQSTYATPIAILSPGATSHSWTPQAEHVTATARIFVGNFVNGDYEIYDWSNQNFAITSSVPANDSCSSATTLTSGTSCNYTAGTVLNATASGVARPSCDGASTLLRDVWYRFTAAATSHTITVDPDGSSGDQVVAVYSSCSGTQLACRDSGGVGGNETLTVTGLSVGSTYYVRVYDYGSEEPTGSNATFRICVTHTAATNYTISLSALPQAGGTVGGAGTYAAGSSRTVTASANSGYTFTNWTESGNVVSSNASYTFNLNGNRSLVANFSAVQSSYTISLSASPQAGGTVSGAGTYAAGSSRTVTASANSGYTFTNWTESGNVVSSNASYTFNLNGNRSLVANFSAVQSSYTISLSALPQAGGTVSGAGTYAAGSSRTVTASANSGYTFTSWTESGNVVSSNASYTFNLNSNRTLVANFSSSGGGSPHPFIEVTGATVQSHDLGAGSNGSVYVLFAQSDPKRLLVVKSTDGGESWQQPVTIPDSDHSNSDFGMDVDSAGTIHVVWYVSSDDQAYYSRSTNGGASFSNPISVRSGNSYGGYSTRNATDPVVASDGAGDVYVAFGSYTQNSSGTAIGYNVWVAKSTNGGSSFQPEIPINAITSAQKKPRRIRATAANFYVLYLDETNDDLYFHRSTAGAFASNPRVSSHADSVDSSGDFVVGPGESAFYAVYSDTFNDSQGNITFCRSMDGGNDWSTCRTVNDNTSGYQEAPAIGIDSAGRLHVAWSDSRGDESQTYYAYSTDGGEVFSTNVDVSDPFTTFRFTKAHVAVDNASASVYFSATREISQVMVARRSSNVQPPTDLTAPAGTISINSGAAYTNSMSVTLTLNATDAVGVTGYYTSNSTIYPSAGQAGWVSVPSTTSFSGVVNNWQRDEDEGTDSVYVWFKDAAGNISSRRSDAITLDLTPPTNPALTATAGPGSVQLTWTGGTDALSGVAGAKLVFAVGSTSPANCSGGALATGSPYTHTGLTPGQPYSYRVCITDNAGNLSSGATATATPQQGGGGVQGVRNDVNGDERADIFWRNTSTGQTSFWFMTGTGYSGTALGPTVPAGWAPAVAGDFDGDGRTDFFWRNASTGQTSVWLGWNGSAFASLVAGVTIPVEWVPIAAGDINGDDRADIFWRNGTTGETSIWFMNGATYSVAIRSTTVPAPWYPAVTGDFDGDGDADIFWRNLSTGETSLWMNWNGSAFATQVRSVTAGPVWVPVGAGDVSGDDVSDIVWRNSSTGQTSLWVMNGAATPAFVVLTTVPTNWGSVAFGDYDGDTRTDVFWRSATTGETSVWLGYNGTMFTTQARSTTAPTAWVPFHSR